MKSHTEYLTLNVSARMEFVNITPRVVEAVRKSGIQEGLCLVNAMHITASVFINDDEPGLHRDYKQWLEQLAPFDTSPERYHHNRTGEVNADAHHKRQIMGREVVVAVTVLTSESNRHRPYLPCLRPFIHGHYSPMTLTSTRFARRPSNSP